MKKNLTTILLFFIIFNSFSQTIQITNNSKSDKNKSIISISWKKILASNPKIDPANFKVIDANSKAEIPFQLEYAGNNEIQNLLLEASVAGKTDLQLNFEKGKPRAFDSKVFARYVPERLDDFAWENDKIAFRAYGKALEGTKGDAYGLDVWVKRTDKLIINTRYKHGDYHHDLGDGLDYYHVGKTLGAGNIAPYVKNNVIYSANYHRWKVLDNGPIRTTFVLEYDAWKVDGIDVTATKKITLDAGTQMNKIEVTYNFEGRDSMDVAIGIIKRPEQGVMLLDEQKGMLAYWEPKHGEDGTTGVATIINAPVKNVKITDEQMLMISKVAKNTPFVYYQGAAWDKAGEITNAQQWFKYIQQFKESINKNLKVVIK
jgi:Domain of unknown function (DUF4861)